MYSNKVARQKNVNPLKKVSSHVGKNQVNIERYFLGGENFQPLRKITKKKNKVSVNPPQKRFPSQNVRYSGGKKVGRARFLSPEKITPIECRRRESNVDENIFLREGKCKSSLEKISFLECKVFWRKKSWKSKISLPRENYPYRMQKERK